MLTIAASTKDWASGDTQKCEELTWPSSSVMDCHATARGSIPGRNGVFTELHVLRKGQ